ncbi:site-specific integrase [Peribacillus muralis]|uniref:site-specific integrase n=1 Tax=Peribacillus muralis TaxID=264697 RepID=UPI003D07194C
MKSWVAADVNKFLTSSQDDKFYIVFNLALTTGMRQSEILGLRWKDIDLEKGILRVNQTLERTVTTKVGGKTLSATRTITLLSDTKKALKKHRQTILNEKIRNADKYQDNDFVVCTRFGTPVSHRNIGRSFVRLVEKANVPSIRFHDMRHTHATLLLLAEVNPKIVAERLGHSRVGVTLDTYSHVLPTMQQGVADKLEQVLNL